MLTGDPRSRGTHPRAEAVRSELERRRGRLLDRLTRARAAGDDATEELVRLQLASAERALGAIDARRCEPDPDATGSRP